MVRRLGRRLQLTAVLASLPLALAGILVPSPELLVAGSTMLAAAAAELAADRATWRIVLAGRIALHLTGLTVLLLVEPRVLPMWVTLLLVPGVLRGLPACERHLPVALACSSMLAMCAVWWSATCLTRVEELHVLGASAVGLGVVLESLATVMEDLLAREQAAADVAGEAERRCRAITTQRAWLATLLDNQPVAIVATDELGHITDLNLAAEQLTGWTLSQARFHPISDVVAVHTVDGSTLDERWMSAVRNGKASDEGQDSLFVAPAGRDLNVAVAVAPIRATHSWQRVGGHEQTDQASCATYGAVISIRPLPAPDERAHQQAYTERLDTFHQIARLAAPSVPIVRGADEPRLNRGASTSDAPSLRRRAGDETHLWLKFTEPSAQAPFPVPALLRRVARDLSSARSRLARVEVEGDENELPEAGGQAERLYEALFELASVVSRTADGHGTTTLSEKLVDLSGVARGFLIGSLPPGMYHRVDIRDSAYGASRQDLLRRFDLTLWTAREDAIAALHLVAAHDTLRRNGGALEFGADERGAAILSVYLPIASLPTRRRPPAPQQAGTSTRPLTSRESHLS